MPSLLISGPAGASKSAIARQLWEDYPGVAAIADFQAIYAALTGDRRGPDGRFPLRDDRLLPLTEYIRRAVITGATSRQIPIIATNSDGRIERREAILGFLGAGATETIIDPGIDIVQARLADPSTGNLSQQCASAIDRWFGNL